MEIKGLHVRVISEGAVMWRFRNKFLSRDPSSLHTMKYSPTLISDLAINCIMRSFIICILCQILLWWQNQGRWDGRKMQNASGRWEMDTTFWSENLQLRT